MKFLWLCSWLLVYSSAWGNDVLPLEDLYGDTNRTVLEAEVARSSTAGVPTEEALRLKRLGIAAHNLAVLEISGASTNAVESLTQAQSANPEDPEVLAYLGSAKTMAARDSWNVVTKVGQSNKGIAMIDKAVHKAPNNIAVRMVRAHNSLALPGFFGRQTKALEDLEYLYVQTKILGIKSVVRAEICFLLGELIVKNGNTDRAKSLFEEARTLAPGSQWSQRAADKL